MVLRTVIVGKRLREFRGIARDFARVLMLALASLLLIANAQAQSPQSNPSAGEPVQQIPKTLRQQPQGTKRPTLTQMVAQKKSEKSDSKSPMLVQADELVHDYKDD